MDDHPGRRRRLLLFLLAVIVPSAAIVVLGARLMMQESRLDVSRQAESFDSALRDFAATLDAMRDAVPDSLIVLSAPVNDGRMVMPWMRATGALQTGAYRSEIQNGEAAEFGRRRYGAAADAYARAEEVAESSQQRALAQLNRMRAARRAGRLAEADSSQARLSRVAPEVTDEFGVPMALYAVSAMSSTHSQLRTLSTHLDAAPATSPQAAYLYRALRDSIRSRHAEADATGPLDAFVQESIAAVRLQEDYSSIAPRLDTGWVLYSDDKWLLTTDSTGAVIVIDAKRAARHAARTVSLPSRGFDTPVLTSSPEPPARFLGLQFAGVYARTRLIGPVGDPGRLRAAVIGLSAFLVISLLTVGVALIWRDARRDLETARLRSDFVSSVSHELKTPLTSIRMYAETLRLRRHEESVKDEYLDTIVSESGRLTRLLNNVLDFAQIEKGTQRFNKTPVDLRRIVADGLEALGTPIRTDGFDVRTVLPPDPVVVRADPDALEQVVLNLLSNAIKFSGTARDIRLAVEQDGSLALLTVEDHGVGIETSDLARLFDPYYRVRSENAPKIAGTGLGLSIVKHTIDAHNGTITVESKPGTGTRFTIALPLA